MSAFFNETFKILGIRKARTSSYHAASNGTVERLHRLLDKALSHYFNAANNWDVLVPFFLMAQRATPSTATGYSPFFLLHGREMTLPSNEDLKAKIPITDRNLKQQMEKLKASLRQAYKEVTVANHQAHQTIKRYYDRRAKRRGFKTGGWVYLYNPAEKPGLTRKFFKPWSGPFQITAKVSELNYEILGKNDRKSVVHINRLK